MERTPRDGSPRDPRLTNHRACSPFGQGPMEGTPRDGSPRPTRPQGGPQPAVGRADQTTTHGHTDRTRQDDTHGTKQQNQQNNKQRAPTPRTSRTQRSNKKTDKTNNRVCAWAGWELCPKALLPSSSRVVPHTGTRLTPRSHRHPKHAHTDDRRRLPGGKGTKGASGITKMPLSHQQSWALQTAARQAHRETTHRSRCTDLRPGADVRSPTLHQAQVKAPGPQCPRGTGSTPHG